MIFFCLAFAFSPLTHHSPNRVSLAGRADLHACDSPNAASRQDLELEVTVLENKIKLVRDRADIEGPTETSYAERAALEAELATKATALASIVGKRLSAVGRMRQAEAERKVFKASTKIANSLPSEANQQLALGSRLLAAVVFTVIVGFLAVAGPSSSYSI